MEGKWVVSETEERDCRRLERDVMKCNGVNHGHGLKRVGCPLRVICATG